MARRFAVASPGTATALGAVVLVLVIANTVLSVLDHSLTLSHIGGGAVAALAYAGVGVVVARHQPRNPVGWILILFVVLELLAVDAGSYAVFCYRLGHPGLPLAAAAVLLVQLWVPAYALLMLVILLFPDGRLTSGRWRPVLRAYAGLVTCVLVVVSAPAVAAVVAGHDIHVDTSGDVTNPPHAAGWLAHPPAWLVAVTLLSVAAIWVSFVAHQVLSWRQATGERHQQLKWLAAGAAVTVGIGLIGSAVISVFSDVLAEVTAVAIAGLAVGIGMGILKYRLYEIDRIISRTLAYAIVTGLLVGVYAGLVLLATEVLRFRTPVAVAAATLAGTRPRIGMDQPARLRLAAVGRHRVARPVRHHQSSLSQISTMPSRQADTRKITACPPAH